MRLIGLVKSIDHVCCRYRLAGFQSLLEKAGHQLELRPWPQSWWSNFWLARNLAHADAVIVLRRLLPAWRLALLRRSVRRLIFDLDDAIFLRSSYAARGPASGRRNQRFARMARASDAVIAGNHFLADHAAALAGRHKVHLVPTCVDPGRYPLARHDKGKTVRLAWIGSSSTLQGLEQSRALWEQIGARCPGLALRLVCDKPLSLEHLPVDFRPWSEATEAADLAAADIGISWVPDDDWSRGKCGLKILQYMAAGLPVVANPVGVQAQMVRHCETGFLAETADEWCDAVQRLARDPQLRRRMGQAGRRVVEDEYSVQAGAARWQSVLRQLAGPPVALAARAAA